jgi:hypothetical protein
MIREKKSTGVYMQSDNRFKGFFGERTQIQGHQPSRQEKCHHLLNHSLPPGFGGHHVDQDYSFDEPRHWHPAEKLAFAPVTREMGCQHWGP